jgi:hypothetical protein
MPTRERKEYHAARLVELCNKYTKVRVRRVARGREAGVLLPTGMCWASTAVMRVAWAPVF